MGKKNSKRKKNKRASLQYRFLLPFCITLLLVTAVGIGSMAAYRWIMEPSGTMHDDQTRPTVEIVEGREEGKKTQIEEQKEDEPEDNGKYADILSDSEYMAENNIYTKDAASPEEVTLVFAGDILFDEHYAVMARMMQNGGDISGSIAPDLISEMKSADIMMLNNEFPYSDRGEPLEDKQFTFRAKTSAVSYLNDLGVDIVSLANNHAYDYGENAFLDTMTTLEEAGIIYVGAGRNLQEARRPVSYIINNMKIAIISATQIERLDNPDTKGATESSAGVFRCWNVDNLLETVREAKENNDFVIVYIHWGTENEATIDWAQEKQAAEIAEAGADMIIGDHPHCLQQIGIVKGVPVMYSLGNFWFNSKTLDTGIFKVVLDENGLQSCRFIACKQSGCRTEFLQGEEKDRVLEFMRSISDGVYIDGDGYVTW